MFGAGSLDVLGDLALELGGGPVLMVTDPGLVEAGWVDRAAQALASRDLTFAIFDGVEENPTESHVARGAAACRDLGARLILGLGGGSAMDCAKGINFVVTNGGRMADYWGFGKATVPMLPSIGVPSTAGTGSEAQSYALISRDDDHVKMACGDEKARFDRVVLDPQLVATAPADVKATTAIDAVSHAIESAVSTAGNPLSRMLCREAFRLLDANFEATVGAGGSASLEALGQMLLGAHLAGAAIETSMLGAAHACANPLTAEFDVTHGAAVGLVLPSVIRFNATVADELYRELVGERAGGSAEGLALRVEQLRAAAGLPRTLDEVGVGSGDIARLAAAAAEQWTATFNPRAVGAAELASLYEASMQLDVVGEGGA